MHKSEKISQEQIDKIGAIGKNIYESSKDSTKENILGLFERIINSDNVISHLRETKKQPAFQEKCFKYIENTTNVKCISDDTESISIDVKDGKLSLDELDQKIISQVTRIYGKANIKVNFVATGSETIEELNKLIDNYGKNLETLDLRECKDKIDNALTKKLIKNCPNLHHLFIRSSKIEDEALKDLDTLTALTTLNLSWCTSLKKLLDLSGLSALTTINISGCQKLTNLSGLSGLSALTTINISWCHKIAELPDFSSLPALTTINISECHKLRKIPDFSGLSVLTTLILSGCENLTELPDFSGLSALTTLDLSYCDNITEENKLSELAKIFEANLERGLPLLEGFDLEDLSSVGKIIADNPNIDLVAKFSILTKYLDLKALTPIAIKISEKDFDFFTENIDKFSISDIIASPLEKSVQLKKLLSYKLNNKLVLYTKIEEVDELSFKDTPGIKIEDLLDFFDKINFSDKDTSGYIDHEKINIDGDPKSKEYVRQGITTLIKRIRDKEKYLAVPADDEERSDWYNKLEYILKNDIDLMKKEKDPVLLAMELISLGGAGHACGSRWMGESVNVYKALNKMHMKNISSQGMVGLIGSWIQSYKEGVVEELLLKYTPIVGRGDQPHIFNYIVKVLNDNKVVLPKEMLVDLGDILMPKERISEDEIMKDFNDYVLPLALAKYVKSKIDDECKINERFIGGIFDVLKDYAKNNLLDDNIKEQIASIEDKYSGKPEKIRTDVSLILENILEEKKLMKYDDVNDIFNEITLIGSFAYLEYFEYILK